MKDVVSHAAAPPLVQTRAFAAAVRAVGGQAHWQSLDGGQVVTLTRALPFGGAVRMASRGPVFDPDTGPRARVALLRDLSLHIVNAADVGAAGTLRAVGFGRVMTGATLAVLDTRADRSDQLALATVKWRNAARQGLQGDLALWMRRFDPSRDRWLIERDLAAQRDRGYRALPAPLILALAQVAPHDLILAGADLNGRTVAAMLFVRHGTGATYQIGWSGDTGRSARAHHAILIDAATRLHGLGVARIDLGTIDTRAAPGLARFKLGSGAVPHQLGGTWIRLPGRRG